jgi:hypothetical protein
MNIEGGTNPKNQVETSWHFASGQFLKIEKIVIFLDPTVGSRPSKADCNTYIQEALEAAEQSNAKKAKVCMMCL